MRKRLATILVVLLYYAGHRSYAQSQLVLIRKNHALYHFTPGDNIRLKTISRKTTNSGTISVIHKDFIVINNADTILVSYIRKVDIRKMGHKGIDVASAGMKLMIAGVLLFAADARNARDEDESSTGIVVVSGVLFGSGLFMQFVNNNYFKVGRRNRLVVREGSRQSKI